MTLLTTASGIAAEIDSRLRAITIANGCETDIGARVFRGRRAIDESVVPCAVLIEGADTPTDQPGRLPSSAITQRYVIAAYVECDPNNPNDAAHAAIRDIKRALFKDSTGHGGTFGGKVKRIGYRGRDIGPRTDGVSVVFATVDIDVDYVENLTEP